jgi:hypothetical protein
LFDSLADWLNFDFVHVMLLIRLGVVAVVSGGGGAFC